MANLRRAIRKLHPQALTGTCSVPTKRSLHAAIEARIDCLLVMLPSQGSYKMDCFFIVLASLSIL